MAERKRLSDTDTSSVNNSKKIKLIQTTLPGGTSKRPLCKYGANCYRKHPDHLKAYDHPSTTTKNDQEDDDDDDQNSSIPEPVEKISTTSSASSSPVKPKPTTASSSKPTTSLMELAELNGEKLLSHLYQMEFPKDLYEFWKFCSNLNPKNPRGDPPVISSFPLTFILHLDAFKNLLNLELVGPFEILDNALKTCKTLPNIHLHYRYYYDTPEFMTVIRTLDTHSQFHLGYYRFINLSSLLRSNPIFL